MAEDEFVIGFEDTVIDINPRLARNVKRGLLSFCCSEGIVSEDRINRVFNRIGLTGYSVERFVREGMDLGRGKYLGCVPVYNDGGGNEYRVVVIDKNKGRFED